MINDLDMKSGLIKNEDVEALRVIVDNLISSFHITIANVENEKLPGLADSFGSIGDITKNDF